MTMAEEMSLGTRIRRARGRMRVTVGQPMSQAELAAAIGMSRSAVNGYETGRVVPPPDVVAAIEQVLNTNLSEDVDPDLQAAMELLAQLRKNPVTEKMDFSEVDARIERAQRRGRHAREGSRADLAS